MYVCLCKALTEHEVASRARDCIRRGVCSPEDIIEVMDLRSEDACGFCADNPEHILAIFEDELELHQGYASIPFEQLAQA